MIGLSISPSRREDLGYSVRSVLWLDFIESDWVGGVLSLEQQEPGHISAPIWRSAPLSASQINNIHLYVMKILLHSQPYVPST